MLNKKTGFRKLDNVAKIFSLDDKRNTNIFRYSVILKHKADKKILKKALIKTLDRYPIFKVRIKTGFFWNYFGDNKKEPIIDKEKGIPCKRNNFIKNNQYIFKVTYFENKINLDIFHVLTDGLGAVIFLKEILYNYLDLKYKLKNIDEKSVEKVIIQDEYIKKANKKLLCKEERKKAFIIQEKTNLLKNKTYHYILDLKRVKELCKKNKVSISEYLTALYIYTIYNTVYNKSSNKDIVISIPIDLRRHYNAQVFSNFFTCMKIEGNILNNKNINFKNILKQVHLEYKTKLTITKINEYLSRDVKLGTNIGIELIPLFIKKTFIKYLGKLINQASTTTLSNVGSIAIDKKYQKYIENIVALVNAGRVQKIKCTICSYENNLNVTINSNLVSNKFEKEFYKILKEHFKKIKFVSNI